MNLSDGVVVPFRRSRLNEADRRFLSRTATLLTTLASESPPRAKMVQLHTA
jgi:hypothetical protein